MAQNYSIPPPEHLSDRSKTLWKEVIPAAIRTSAGIALVQVALEALDRAEEARLGIQANGMTVMTKSTGAVHLNPLVRVEKVARKQFASIWGTQLKLGSQWKFGNVAEVPRNEGAPGI